MTLDLDLTQTTHEFDFPGGTLFMEIPRCTSLIPSVWPDAQMVAFNFEASFDNGPWIPAGGCEAPGGIHVQRDGTESLATTFRCPYPGPARVRLTLSAPVSSVALIESR